LESSAAGEKGRRVYRYSLVGGLLYRSRWKSASDRRLGRLHERDYTPSSGSELTMKTLTTTGFMLLLASFASHAEAASSLKVSHLWSRPATVTAVVYATITNHGSRPDRFIGATSPLGAVEMHKSIRVRTTSIDGMPIQMSRGAMRMTEVTAMTIPAHRKVTLTPGGYHLMIVHLKHPLHAGTLVPLRLHFSHAGWIATRARVRPYG